MWNIRFNFVFWRPVYSALSMRVAGPNRMCEHFNETSRDTIYSIPQSSSVYTHTIYYESVKSDFKTEQKWF